MYIGSIFHSTRQHAVTSLNGHDYYRCLRTVWSIPLCATIFALSFDSTLFQKRNVLVSEKQKRLAKFWTDLCSTTKLCGLESSINFQQFSTIDQLRFWTIVEIKWMKVENENKMRINIFIVRVFYFGSGLNFILNVWKWDTFIDIEYLF